MTTGELPRLVLVKWVDSYGCSSSWERIEEPFPPTVAMECRSVGWLAYDGDDCKVVIPHMAGAGPGEELEQGCGDMTIPAKAIISVVDLVPKESPPSTRISA